MTSIRTSKNEDGFYYLSSDEGKPLRLSQSSYLVYEYLTNGMCLEDIGDLTGLPIMKLLEVESILKKNGYLGPAKLLKKRKIFPLLVFVEAPLPNFIFKQAHKLSFLIHMRTAPYLIAMTISFFAISVASHIPKVNYSWYIYVLILLLAGILHELGHVIAATSCGIRVKSVGFGLYLFVFPAFFVSINEIYHGSSNDKRRINSGGVYFALNLLLPIYLSTYLFRIYEINHAVNIAILIQLFNLLPFYNSDGYWLVEGAIKVKRVKRLVKIVSLIVSLALLTKNVSNLLSGWMY